MRGGHAALAVQLPSVLHPKSNPAMFTPANRSFPAVAAGVLGAHDPEGVAGADELGAGVDGVDTGTEVGADVGTEVGAGGAEDDDGAAEDGRHCE